MARLPFLFLFLETCRELDSFAVGYDPSVLSGGDSSTAICHLNGNGGQSRAGLKRKRVAKLAARRWTGPQGGATRQDLVTSLPPAIATIRGVSRSVRASLPPAAFVRCRNPPRHVR